ncbi:hypothetical protein BGZ83_005398, partial [Gryganskiella cystojenkinii]
QIEEQNSTTIMPATPILSETPYGQVNTSATSSTGNGAPNPVRPVASLISAQDLSPSLGSATLQRQEPVEIIPAPTPLRSREFVAMFRVRNDVEDHMKMYYADKTQRKDLPTVIAESQGCRAELSEQGEPRTVTIIGPSQQSVNLCRQQMEQMQEYFLRRPFMAQRLALFYGNPSQIYRVRFMQFTDHPYHSTHTKFFPGHLDMKDPQHYCVAVKATFDKSRGIWAFMKEPSTKTRESMNFQTTTPVTKQPFPQLPSRSSIPFSYQVADASTSASASASASAAAASASGTTATAAIAGRSDQEVWPLARLPDVKSSMWSTAKQNTVSTAKALTNGHTVASPTWGTHARTSAPSAQKSAGSWPSPPTNRLAVEKSSTGWAASADCSSNWAGSSSGTVRALQQSEWPAPTFDNREEGDFPTLPKAKAPVKKGGIPALPPVRVVPPSAGAFLNVGAGAQSSQVSTHASSSSLPPAFLTSTPQFVFGDADFEFLEKTTRITPPATTDSLELAIARLRDPAKEEEDRRREMRNIIPQQATPDTTWKELDNFLVRARSFNLRRQAETIRLCLDELRGQRKEIRLIGRLGSVVYPKESSLANKVFECQELSQLKADFSPISTVSQDNIETLYGYLGHPNVDTAHYEVYCNSRNNPQTSWISTLITIPSNKAILDRVVTPWETLGEVTWNALDRDLDFELLVQARQGISRNSTSALGRTDVKPYRDFQKKLSLGTKNSHITCHEIADYLEVQQIVFRESKHFDRKDESGFTIVVHRVEELQLTREQRLGLVKGLTRGRGRTWYEIEVHCESINRWLKSNLTLTPGLVADWEPSDLIGDTLEEATDRPLVRMVKQMMELASECQQKFYVQDEVSTDDLLLLRRI